MLFDPQERIALFIDGANLYAAARALGFDIDYKRLLELFGSKGRLIRAFYYTALLDDQEYSPIRPLVDWLDYNGYTMVTKPTKEFTDATGRRKIKGNMDIELAIDVMEMAQYLDHIVLFSGDGDFRRLVEAVQRRGVRVSVVSTVKSQPPMVADELRRQADVFVELEELSPLIARQHGGRQHGGSPAHAGNHGQAAATPSFGPANAKLLIVGLAPGLHGANRTGRPFTGDWAGDLLFGTLLKLGLATGTYEEQPDDTLQLVGCRIINSVRCVPPQNKPLPVEITTCNQFLKPEILASPAKAMLALGAIAHDAALKALGEKKSRFKFAHAAQHALNCGLTLVDSYHCSRYNTNTGVLTPTMF